MQELDDNMSTKVIIYFTHTAEKKSAFLQIFGTKTKAKKQKQKTNTRFGNIEYNSWEICTIISCFAFK